MLWSESPVPHERGTDARVARSTPCAGANAYLTPRGTQGLAPHTDPVEILVVQTQGRKAWRLYPPLGAFPLPNQASGDLEQVTD